MKVVFAVSLLLAMVAPAGGEDLGIINERDPEEGVVFGGQPSADQVVELAAAGFKTVIDLRGESEDRGFDEDTAETDESDRGGRRGFGMPDSLR